MFNFLCSFFIDFSVFFLNKCYPGDGTCLLIWSSCIWWTMLYCIWTVLCVVFSELWAKKKKKERAPLDQIFLCFYFPQQRCGWVSAVLLSTTFLGCVWKVRWKLWAIPACYEPGPITYNHHSHPSYCSPSVTLLPFSSLHSFCFFYMSLYCPQRWETCGLHYCEQLKITLSTSVYLLSISSNMDITCFPAHIQPGVNSGSRPPHFKGALISALVLSEYIPYAWALSNIYSGRAFSYFCTVNPGSSRTLEIHLHQNSVVLFLIVRDECMLALEEAQSCVHGAWSILGLYHAISLTPLNKT